MTLDPRLAAVAEASLTASPTPGGDHGLSPGALRAALDERAKIAVQMLTSDGPPVASIVDHRVAVAGGENAIRVYTPHGAGPFPVHLYFHSGGYFAGSPWILDSWCQRLAEGAQCVVGSAQYRLAPEHKFPIAAEDGYAALLWLSANGDDIGGDIGGDTDVITVGGASAGGGLAAATALMARDRGGPTLALQVLETPVLDLRMQSASYETYAQGYVLSKRGMQQYAEYYLSRPEDALHPLASPLLADDLSGLPPALVLTAECDPLRDEAEAYGERLTAAGVPTTVTRYDGLFHGAQYMDKLVPDIAARYLEAVVAALRAAARPG